MSNKKKDLKFLDDFSKARFSKNRKSVLFINEKTGECVSFSSLYLLKMLFPAISLIQSKSSK